MNQAKTNRTHIGAKKPYRPSGPKVRIVNLRAKGYHAAPLTEHAVQEVKRFYNVVDTLRLGNYKTGFNTYQHGLVIVDGFTHNRIEDNGIRAVTGTLFAVVAADEYLRIAAMKGEPNLIDYVQALFIEDGTIVHTEGGETKITFTKFKSKESARKTTVTYQGLEAFVAQLSSELFALDILPQFVKKDQPKAAPQVKREVREVREARTNARAGKSRIPRAKVGVHMEEAALPA